MALAYVAALIPALVMAVTQPVWSRVDEAQHTDFIIQLSHGHYPLADTTVIDPETLRISKATGVYRFEGPGTYPTPDLTDIGPPPAGMSPRANAVWMSRHLWQLSYESAQTPGYYVVMVPLWSAADRIAGTMAAIYVMRIINALLIALLAPMAVIMAWRLAPERPVVAALAALFAVLLPGLDLNVTRVGNDALAAVIGGLMLVLAVGWTGAVWTPRKALALGALLGAAVLVKLTLLGFAPAVAVAMLWPAGGAKLPRRMLLLVLAGVVTLAFLCVWLAINLHLYGAPVPSARTNRLSIVAPMPFDVRFVPFEVAFFLVSYWSGEPLGVLPFATGFVALGVLLALIATAGVLKVRRPGGMILVGVAAIAGMAAVSLVLPATAAFQFAGPGRYEYPALPATAALMAIGLTAAMARAFAWRTLAGMYGAGAAVLLAGGVAGVGADVTPSGSAAPPAGSLIFPAPADAQFNGVDIRIRSVLVDPQDHATWLDVTATNNSADEIEWSPAPTVYSGSVLSTAEYERGTHLPGDLNPGQSVSGWVYVPAAFEEGESLRIVFPGVAVENYRTVGDVTLTLQLSV